VNADFDQPVPVRTEASVVKRIFAGRRGVRAGWRFLLFLALSIAVGIVFRLAVVALVGLIGLAGGLHISGLALTGSALLASAGVWLVAMLLLGGFEELYFRGYPLFTGNGGKSIADHLLDVAYTGPDWLTRGPRGIEASAVVFVVIVLLFAIFHFRDRGARYPLPEAEATR
jgi:hypothetical protein